MIKTPYRVPTTYVQQPRETYKELGALTKITLRCVMVLNVLTQFQYRVDKLIIGYKKWHWNLADLTVCVKVLIFK